jgi:DNA polymerase-3 subunit epsilon
MKDFAAIDFETANRAPTSVCSVGVVVVRGGVIVERLYELIRPTPNFYDYWNTRIHGLSASDTATADPFPEVWERISPSIEGLPLVAHNSPFDRGCLRAAHLHYGMPYPDYPFHCTCRASRRAHPSLPDHKLHTVAAHVGFDLRHHHHALADAEACAAIALAIM